MNSLGRSILAFLSKSEGPQTAQQVSAAIAQDLASVMSVLEGLRTEGLVELQKESSKRVTAWLNAEGISYFKDGTPERRLASVVKKSGSMPLAMAVSMAKLTDSEKQVAFKWAVQEKLLQFDKKEGAPVLRFLADVRTTTEKALEAIGEMRLDVSAIAPELLANLKSRRILEEKEEPKPVLAKLTEQGRKMLSAANPSQVTQLTPQMLRDGSWKKARFSSYDLDTAVVPTLPGARQPYLKFVRQIKDALVGLGFEEASGPLVESEFWNMDALFMPQDHPARDIHDVFHTDLPPAAVSDAALWARVKKAHEGGLVGSKGWGYRWNESLSKRVVLRSQTTTVSARSLAQGRQPPFRVFSVGRVFRPDEIDWKHFIEFNQCEGIVADEGMSFRELLGYLRSFAVEIFGAESVKFVPGYFPFTEPSVEMYAKVQGKWTEVGGAGMFRPEMLAALGVSVPVLAWGLGLDRLAMKKLGITDIRELFSQDVNYLRRS